jgi:PadR family transcriptional regulator, regulatory protein PadR
MLFSAGKSQVAGLGSATGKLVRGLLEVLVLDAIGREPRHGYALLRELEDVFGEPPNRNQVYPLLNRLEKDGYLRADREEGRGKTRYHLTGKGVELLKEYRVRSPAFRGRIAALWLPDALASSSQAAPGNGEPRPPGPHLVDRLALASEAAPPGPRAVPAPAAPGGSHAGQPCTAEVSLRRQPGQDVVRIEYRGLDPACATCQDLAAGLRGVRDRWF